MFNIKIKQLFPFFQKNGEKNGEKTIKYFWFYSATFFLAALVLILITNFFQGQAYQAWKDEMGGHLLEGETRLEVVTGQYNQMKKERDSLKIELDEAKGSLRAEQFINDQIKIDIENLKEITDAQILYSSGSKAAARQKLANIDTNSLSSEILEYYETVTKIIK